MSVGHRYERLAGWRHSPANGWTADAVALRFEGGTDGSHYLEHWPFGPDLAGHPATRELERALARTGLVEGRLLDFGCGNGVLYEVLRAAGLAPAWDYVGLDVNARNVLNCRRRYPACSFDVVAPDARLPLPAASVDVVVVSGVLECIANPAERMAEFARVSRQWLLLCRLGLRSAGAEAFYWQSVEHAWGREEHCVRVFSRPGLEAMASEAGWTLAWEERSEASGTWEAPDDPEPLPYYTWLLRRL